MYHFDIPSCGEDGTGRQVHSLATVPAHEAVNEDWENNPGMRVRLNGILESYVYTEACEDRRQEYSLELLFNELKLFL